MKRQPRTSVFRRILSIEVIWAGIKHLFLLCNNTISILGILSIAVSLVLMFVYWAAPLVGVDLGRYLEAFIVLVAPGFFLGGLVIVPLGIFRMHQKELKTGSIPKSFEIQVKDRRFRGSVGIFLVATLFVTVPVLAVSGYKVYNLTESTRFCGEYCHPAMKPQSLAHAQSPHARVTCAECHIGHGADFFVKSKISGIRQIYAIVANTCPSPIPPAITELRPARDTFEECHWPSKFFGTQYKKKVHFSFDENNSRREVEILVKTGGANLVTGRAEGIHMHMLAAGKVDYIATDDKLQEIPWVQYKRKNGETSVFRKVGESTEHLAKTGVRRTVDCMDCHNRGAHHFSSPQTSMEIELESKRIDSSLPYIVREGVDALLASYQDSESAKIGIEQRLLKFYKENYPEIWQNQQTSIRQAVSRIQTIYSTQFFPEMKADWRTYPENTGHQFSKGCFRCHDGLHVDDKNRPISSDCTICHLFVNNADRGLDCLQFDEFRHPNSLSIHRNVLCSSCHGEGKHPTCKDCHEGKDWSDQRGKGEFRLPDDGKEYYPPDPYDTVEASDKLFRLVPPKDEWESTESIRIAEPKNPDMEERQGGEPR